MQCEVQKFWQFIGDCGIRKKNRAGALRVSYLRLKSEIRLNRPQTTQKHKESPLHRCIEQDELFYCISESVYFGDNLKFAIHSFI